MIYLYLFIAGVVAFTISTLTAGGGALMLLPVLSILIGAPQVAPVLNLGNFIGRPVRLILFWKHIHWGVVKYYVPSAILGAWLGARFLVYMNVNLMELLMGLFLVSTIFQFNFAKRRSSFKMKLIYFIPLGLVVPFIGSVTGAFGPILNPFLFNFNLSKEQLIATKTVSAFVAGAVQISTYTFFGLLDSKLVTLGLILGLGIALGNFIGKRFLKKISEVSFQKGAIVFMVLSGLMLIYRSLF